MDNTHVPPQAIEAEQSVIGAMMLDSRVCDDVFDVLVAGDFYNHAHQLIFAAIEGLRESKKSVDVVTVSDVIEQQNLADKTGGLAYLSNIAKNTPNIGNTVNYAKIVKDKSRRRQVIEVARDAITQAYNSPVGTDDLVEYLSNAGAKISIDSVDQNKGINTVLSGAVELIDERRKQGGGIIGLSTSLPDLDELLSGLQAGKLYTIAARPAHGKSTLMMNIAEENALAGKVVQVFTLEMTADEMGIKLLSSQGGIDHSKLQAAKLEQEEWARMTNSIKRLAGKKMFVDDSTSLTMSQIKSRCRKVKSVHGLDIVLIDYLGLMETDNSGNLVNDISKITRGMKNLAKDLDIPVVLLCQLNREVEKRADKRPINSDLRDSGAIEQDSNVVMFIYREEVYKENTEEKGLAEIIVRKNRGGKIGTVRVGFQGKYQRFKSFSEMRRGAAA